MAALGANVTAKRLALAYVLFKLIAALIAILAFPLTVSEQGMPGIDPQPTVSVGVVSYPADGRSADALLVSADRAMYASKRGGKNRVARAAAEPMVVSIEGRENRENREVREVREGREAREGREGRTEQAAARQREADRAG